MVIFALIYWFVQTETYNDGDRRGISEDKSVPLTQKNDSDAGVEEPFLFKEVAEGKPNQSVAKLKPSDPANPKTERIVVTGTGKTIEWKTNTPAARRAERVNVAPEILQKGYRFEEGERIRFDLFQGITLVAEITSSTENVLGAVSTVGRLVGTRGVGGMGDGRFKMSSHGGRVLVELTTQGGTYQIVTNQKGEHALIDIDFKNSDIQSCELEAYEAERKAKDSDKEAESAKLYGHRHTADCKECMIKTDTATESVSSMKVEADESVAGEDNTPPPINEGDMPAGSVATINLMIIYSTEAKNWANTSGGGIENVVTLTLSKINEVHANSETGILYNLVHSEETVGYTQSSTVSSTPLLNDLRYLVGSAEDPEGDLDSYHTLRNTVEADFIMLLGQGTGWGGLANRPYYPAGNDNSVFSVVRVEQSSWTYTAPHELTHNLGAQHSKTQTSSPADDEPPNAAFTFGAGWQWADTASTPGGFCTIMTYEDFNNDGSNDYNRIPYFSDPNRTYTGNSTNAIGHATNANNTQLCRIVRFNAASYRGSVQKPNNTVNQFPYTESFENGSYGAWYNAQANGSWSTHAGLTFSSNTGPTIAQSGSYYVYCEGSGHESATYDLQAAFDFSNFNNISLTFYTHLYGSASSHLRLQVSTDNGNSWSSNLWSQSGSGSTAWTSQQTVDLSAYSGQTVLIRFRNEKNGAWNSDFAIDNINITANVAVSAPRIHISGNGAIIVHGDTTPATYDNTVFETRIMTKETTTQTFTIGNTGTGTLTLTGIGTGNYVSLSGTGAGAFSVTTQPASSISAGSSTNFVLTYAPVTSGVHTATVAVQSNDVNNGTYSFTVTGNATDKLPILIDFGTTPTSGNWNSVTSSLTGTQIVNMVDTFGIATGYGFHTDYRDPAGTGSTTRTLDGYPATAAGDYIYVGADPTTVGLQRMNFRINGLDTSGNYELFVVGSVSSSTVNSITGITVQGTRQTLVASNQGTLTFSNVTPNGMGEIAIILDNDSLGRGYISLMELRKTIPVSSYVAWSQTEHGLSGNDVLSTADPDDDNVNNLLEFAFNSNPTVADVNKLPQVSLSGNILTITYRKNKSANTVTVIPQSSTDLQIWSDLTPIKIGDADGGTEQWTATYDLSISNGKGFLRVKVVE